MWLAYGVWTLRAGVHVSVDTATYSRWADLLIANHFNIPAYLHEEEFYIPPVLYTGWIVVVATLKSVFGASWVNASVLLNWLAFGAGSYAILAAVRRITASAAGLLLAVALLVVAGDLLIFIPFALSDLLFWGMASVTLASGCRLALSATAPATAIRIAAAVTLLVLYALIFRPGGMALPIFWAASLASAFARKTFDRISIALLVTLALVAVIAVSWHAAIMVDTAKWPFAPLTKYFAVLSHEYRTGVLVDAPESDLMVAPAVTWPGAMRLTVQKMLYFVTPWLPHYSRMHTVMNLAFFLPVYGLSMAALINRARLTESQRRVVLLLTLFIFNVIVNHSLIELDYDHRYRLPMLAALIILAAIGVESIRRPEPVGGPE